MDAKNEGVDIVEGCRGIAMRNGHHGDAQYAGGVFAA
jgi:hypothetical protein